MLTWMQKDSKDRDEGLRNNDDLSHPSQPTKGAAANTNHARPSYCIPISPDRGVMSDKGAFKRPFKPLDPKKSTSNGSLFRLIRART